MKNLFFLIAFVSNLIYSQTFFGKVENQFSQGLEGKKVEIFFNIDGSSKRFLDWTDALGNFSADSVSTSDVNDENLLPIGYEVSLNYPQPFNPKTVFNITLPRSSQISVDVFTILGEKILSLDKKDYYTGLNKLVIELNGFSNGVYIARINFDNKYFISRKMLLLYGSQHAKGIEKYSYTNFSNTTTTTTVDSVVITGDAIKKKTITGFPQYTGDNINLGTFTIDSNYVNLTLNIKKLMEWTQTNNQLANAQVNLSGQEATTDANGQAIFNNTPSGRNSLTITHPEIYTRETILRLENDSTHTEYILDTLNYPQVLMNFTDDILGKIINGEPYKMRGRWTEPPIFYIVADTTTETGRWRAQQQIAKIDTILKPTYTTPQYPEGFLKNREIQIGTNIPYGQEGYYVIEWKDSTWFPGTTAGLTYVNTDTATGRILYAESRYKNTASPIAMDYMTIHELSTGLSATGRSNTIPSVWNNPLPSANKNFTPTDLQIILYQYSRPPGNKIVDKDDGF